MFIKTLKCSNVRGVSGSWEIGPAVMIVGDNFRGKSALLHAIRLGIFGWIPHPRKDSEMTPMRLASADIMAVGLALDNDQIVARSWKRDAKGSVSSTGVKDVEPLAPAIMVDPKQYFDASPAKRMQYVFSSVRLPESDFSMAAVLAEVKNITLKANTEATELALKTVATTFTDSIAEAEREALNVQDWVEHILATCSEKQKLAKQSVDRMGKTVAGLTELELRRPEQFDAEIGEVDALLVNRREELAKWNSERGRVDGELKTVTQRMQQRQIAQRVVDGEPTLLRDIELWDTARVRGEAQLKEPLKDFTDDMTAAKGKVAAAQELCGGLQKQAQELTIQIAAARDALAAANQAIHSNTKLIKELTGERDADLNSPCCPTCDAPGSEWKERITAKYAKKIAAYQEYLDGATQTAATHRQTLDNLTPQLDTTNGQLSAASSAVRAAEQGVRNVEQESSKQSTDRKAVESNLGIATAKLEGFAKEKQRIADSKQYLADTKDESDVSLRTDAANIAMKISNLSTEIGTLDVQRTQIVANKSSVANQLQAVRERDKAQAELDIWKETIKVVTTFQRKMVDAAFGSMMGVANQFADGILASALEYVDGEVGRRRDGRFVPHDQFSDAEQIITYAAMSIALAASAPFKVVIVDELTRVRGERKAQILERMIELVERGVIDQFFGVDTETDDGQVPEYYKHESVDIIHIK